MRKFRVSGVAMKVFVGVKGFRNCRREFAWEFRVLRTGAKVHARVKRFWNCK
jgi:hypothetical protein